jgi:hypothetical protein
MLTTHNVRFTAIRKQQYKSERIITIYITDMIVLAVLVGENP